jgi:hypothetical protein
MRARLLAAALVALGFGAAAPEGPEGVFRGVTKGSRLEHVEDLVLRNVVLEPERQGNGEEQP